MKISYWVSLCVSLLLLGITPDFTGCRIFALFGEDSSAQGNSLYTPPAIPETLEQERPAVQARVIELSQALSAENVDKVVELCNEQEGCREKFEENKGNFHLMAESLKSARLTHLADGYGSYDARVGQITVDVGSKSFALPIVKIKGKWFFQDL